MKKFGFTLAEVLITLGIIGVVAALTMPAIVNQSGIKHVGPTLQKVVSSIAQANEAILNDENITDLALINDDTRVGDQDYTPQGIFTTYFNRLSRYIAGSSYQTDGNDAAIISNSELRNSWHPEVRTFNNRDVDFQNNGDGAIFEMPNNITIIFTDIRANHYRTTSDGNGGEVGVAPPSSYLGPFMQMEIDINGLNRGRNTYGEDVFRFTMDRNGTIIPWGSKKYAWLYRAHGPNDTTNADTWETITSDISCSKTRIITGYGCAGSIFENNLKVIYK